MGLRAKLLVGIVGLIALDQLLKSFAPAVGGTEALTTAGPFMLTWPRGVYLAYAVIVVLALGWIFKVSTAIPASLLVRLSVAALLAGGISNVLDRALHGGVIDNITLGTLHTNLADCYIVLGIFGFVGGMAADNSEFVRTLWSKRQ